MKKLVLLALVASSLSAFAGNNNDGSAWERKNRKWFDITKTRWTTVCQPRERGPDRPCRKVKVKFVHPCDYEKGMRLKNSDRQCRKN